MKLTIGMAHANDFHGVFFTVQALRLYQDLKDCEIVIIDNTPASKHGQEVKNLVDKIKNHIDIRYIPYDVPGTTQSREQVFLNARGKAVLCLDCHVLLAPDAIKRLKEWYDDDSHTDFYSGPLLLDDLKNACTHFDLIWRSEMYGVWGSASKCRCGYIFSNQEGQNYDMNSTQKSIGYRCPNCFQDLLPSINNRVGLNTEEEPFQIPANGLGIFSCRKDCWLGFNPNFRHFGGEEGYIHLKYEKHGKKTMCLPFLQWNHRFGRPDGIHYTVSLESKVKNYIYGFKELGLPLDSIKDHFKNRLNEQQWNALVLECEGRTDKPKAEVYQQSFEKMNSAGSRIMRQYISGAKTVVDYSSVGESLITIFAEAIPRVYFYQYNTEQGYHLDKAAPQECNVTRLIDFPKEAPACDVAIIGELPADKAKIMDALNSVKNSASQYIIISNIGKTDYYVDSINEWLKDRDWKIVEYSHHSNGLIVLSRGAKENIVNLNGATVGVGQHLKKYLSRIGITSTETCQCNNRARLMNILGIEWCKNNTSTILDWLAEESAKRKLPFVRMGASMLVNMAIRKATKS